jgi:hypothetical protein
VTDTTVVELLASCEAALAAAKRSLAIARALAEGHRSGVRPPEDIIEAYLIRVERDEARIGELHEKIAQVKGELTKR